MNVATTIFDRLFALFVEDGAFALSIVSGSQRMDS